MKLQRARGVLRLAVRRRGDVTAIADLRQEGCLKARFPRADGLEVVLLNTSGGVAGGDVLNIDIALAKAAEATITTQAAERFYRARSGEVSTVNSLVTLGDFATLHWLPQEAILFDGCAMRRTLSVRMAAGARFLGVESLVFGRKAMGEQVHQGAIADTIRIERAGRLILHDAIRLSGSVAGTLARPAVAGGGAAVATLVHVAPDAESRIDPLREALAGVAVEAGASAWDGMLVARLVARDGACLRAGILAGLAVLRPAPPPRVWLF